MQTKQYLLLAFAALAAPVLAQSEATTTPATTPTPTTGASPSQTTIFQEVLSQYLSSFKASPQFTALALGLNFALPQSVISSLRATPGNLIPVPTGSAFNLQSFATNPPTAFPQLDWESYLSTNTVLQSSVDSVRTSAVLALATSAQQVVGVSASINSAAPTSSSAAAAARAAPTGGVPGVAGLAGVIGAAAVGAAAIAL